MRIPTGLVAIIAAWDASSNQFSLPKIPRLWGMTGSLLPWWGWLLVAHAILVLSLFEYVRRNGGSRSISAELVDEERVREIFDGLLAARWDDIQSTIVDDVSARLVVVEKDIFAHTDERFESQLQQIALAAGEFAGFKEETEKRLLGNDYAFAAIGHREVLLKYAFALERGSESLDLKARGGSLSVGSAWNDWERDYRAWLGDLDHWLIFASPYWSDIQAIKKLPDNIHKLAWTFGDDQFPNSAAIHEYRSFCVVHHNWSEVKDRVHATVRKVAFEGGIPVNAKV